MSKVSLTGTGVLATVAVVAVVAVGLYLWSKKDKIVASVNPASDKNLAYKGVSEIVQAVTGDQDATLGTSLYNATHNGDGSFRLPWQPYKPIV